VTHQELFAADSLSSVGLHKLPFAKSQRKHIQEQLLCILEEAGDVLLPDVTSPARLKSPEWTRMPIEHNKGSCPVEWLPASV
jgi:hypothetical protein